MFRANVVIITQLQVPILRSILPGPVFTKGLNQVLGLNIKYKRIKFKLLNLA